MDLIGALQRLLDPLVAQTSFVLISMEPLSAGAHGRYGLLEYHGVLASGRVVLLGFYQRSELRILTAEIWSPTDLRGMPPEASVESVAMRYKVWPYDPTIDADELARTVVGEVTSWLQSLDPTSDPDSEAPPAEA